MVMAGEDEKDRLKRQRKKNWALLAALMAFVVIVYIVSIIRMGGG
jgi:hypothetical protein